MPRQRSVIIAAHADYAVCLPDVACSFEAERLAVKQGFLLAKELGLEKVIFETDCARVAECLWFGPPSTTNFALLRWISLCSLELSSHKEWRINLVQREANSVADFAATYATDSRTSGVFF